MRIRKRMLLCTLALCLLPGLSAMAEERTETTGRVAEGEPLLSIVVSDTGETSDDTRREKVLCVTVTAQDGSFTQELRYNATISPEQDGLGKLAQLVDMNFDGSLDLCLLTAMGARNAFYALSLWDSQAGRFLPVQTLFSWLPDEDRFAATQTQLELCNYELYPQTREIFSEIQDGFYYRTQIVYGWESDTFLCEDSVAHIYDAGKSPAGEDLIGEKLTLFATGITACWDQHYPEDWYMQQIDERLSCIEYLTLGHGLTDPLHMQVAGTSWVNLRQQDSIDSPSLARLNEGTLVYVLKTGCGADGGWVRVFCYPEDEGVTGLTGYIWHSFLRAA